MITKSRYCENPLVLGLELHYSKPGLRRVTVSKRVAYAIQREGYGLELGLGTGRNARNTRPSETADRKNPCDAAYTEKAVAKAADWRTKGNLHPAVA